MSKSPPRQRGVLAALLGLAALTAVATLAAPQLFRALPPITPDSLTYLQWNPGRAPAYPLFLSVLGAVSLDLLGPVQLVVFLSAAIWCALTLARVFEAPLIAVAFAAAVMLHPQLVSYAFVTLPESLFTSILLVNLGLMMRASQRQGQAAYVLVGASAAALVLLKPSGYGVLAGLAALALSARAGAWRQAAMAAAIVALTLGVVSAFNLVRHGYFAPQAQGGFSLVAHAGPFVQPVSDGPLAEVTNAIAADVLPHRQALEAIGDVTLYYLFSSHDYHVIERIVRQRIGEDAQRRLGAASSDEAQFPSNPILLAAITTTGATIARRAILDQPTAYLRHVGAQLYALWLLPLFQPAHEVERLTDGLEQIRSTSPVLDRSPVAFRAVPQPVFVSIRTLLVAMLSASILALALFLRRREARLAPLAYAALGVHANFLLVAAVQPGLPRYAVVMWPAQVLVLTATWAVLWRRIWPGSRVSR